MHTHHRALAASVVLGLGLAFLAAGCGGGGGVTTAPRPDVPEPVEDMMAAHGDAVWRQLSEIQYATEVDFAGLVYRSQTNLRLEDWFITERVIEPVGFTMRAGGEIFEIPEGSAPPDFNAEALINRWPYFLAAPFVIADESTGLTYLGPVLIDGRLYDAVHVVPDTAGSKCPVDWLVAYITSHGNDVGVGHLAMLRYPVAYPTGDGQTILVGEHVAVYEPLTWEMTAIGPLILPNHVTFHAWLGDYEVDGPEGRPDWDETIGTVTFGFLGAE